MLKLYSTRIYLFSSRGKQFRLAFDPPAFARQILLAQRENSKTWLSMDALQSFCYVVLIARPFHFHRGSLYLNGNLFCFFPPFLLLLVEEEKRAHKRLARESPTEGAGAQAVVHSSNHDPWRNKNGELLVEVFWGFYFIFFSKLIIFSTAARDVPTAPNLEVNEIFR